MVIENNEMQCQNVTNIFLKLFNINQINKILRFYVKWMSSYRQKNQTYDNESPALPSNNSLYHTNQIITQRNEADFNTESAVSPPNVEKSTAKSHRKHRPIRAICFPGKIVPLTLTAIHLSSMKMDRDFDPDLKWPLETFVCGSDVKTAAK